MAFQPISIVPMLPSTMLDNLINKAKCTNLSIDIEHDTMIGRSNVSSSDSGLVADGLDATSCDSDNKINNGNKYLDTINESDLAEHLVTSMQSPSAVKIKCAYSKTYIKHVNLNLFD